MNILLIMDPGIVVPPLKYGGIERIVFLLAKEYQNMGHQVTLLAGPGSHCAGSTIHYGNNNLNRSKREKLRDISFVWNYLFRNQKKFGLIHNFGRLVYLLPVLHTRVIKIMSYQRAITARNINLITRLPNKNLHFTACSDSCKFTDNQRGSWHTIYNAVEFSQYQAKEKYDSSAALMFLGRLDKVKGAHTAIQAAKDCGHKLWVAGNIPEGGVNLDYYNTCIASQLDGDQIIYLGELNDEQKNYYLGKSKGLMFPIDWEEPFGIVMIEAMACGTPVIAFDKGSVREVIAEGKTGFIIKPGSSMLEAIKQLSTVDRMTCRDIAQSRFDIRIIARQYLQLAHEN